MGKIRGYVQDIDTEDAISDVDIYSLNSAGKTTGVIGTSDQEGNYEFEQPAFGLMVQFDAPGYKPKVVDPALIGFSGKIELETDPNANYGEVIVQGVIKKVKQEVKKPNYIVPIALGATSVILAVWAFKFL